MGLELIVSTLGRVSEASNDKASPGSKLEAQAWIVNGKVQLVSEGLISCINEPTATNKIRKEDWVASSWWHLQTCPGREPRAMTSLSLQAQQD